jgi:uncharacterized protein
VRKKYIKGIGQFIFIIFLVLNVLAYVGAYGLTHFKASNSQGLGSPRPENYKVPTDIQLKYSTQRLTINDSEWLEVWLIPISNALGTVILFPGNGGSKDDLLASAREFYNLGYETLLVDFRGVGGSSGSTSTVGMREAKDVAVAMDYIKQLKPNRPLILYGVSMGTAAILKAIAQENVKPDAVILELPFARFIDAVRNRLRVSKIPTFPIAELIIFWGSVQYGYNGFAHNPVSYATQVKCPTLILHGKLDKSVTMTEVNEIFQNLNGSKQLVVFPNAGHNLLVTVDKEYWQQSISQFLQQIQDRTL